MSCQGSRIKAGRKQWTWEGRKELLCCVHSGMNPPAAQPPVVDDQCQVEDASHAKQGYSAPQPIRYDKHADQS